MREGRVWAEVRVALKFRQIAPNSAKPGQIPANRGPARIDAYLRHSRHGGSPRSMSTFDVLGAKNTLWTDEIRPRKTGLPPSCPSPFLNHKKRKDKRTAFACSTDATRPLPPPGGFGLFGAKTAENAPRGLPGTRRNSLTLPGDSRAKKNGEKTKKSRRKP